MSEIKRFNVPVVKTNNEDILTLGEHVQFVFDTIAGIPFIDGITLSIDLASGDNLIEHKLQRKPRGYFLIYSSAQISINSDEDQNTSTHLFINSSGVATVKLWVF